MKLTYVYVLKYAFLDSAKCKYYFGVTSNNLWQQLLSHISGYGSEITRRLGVREVVAVYNFGTREEGEFFKQLLMDKQKYDSEFEIDATENSVHIDVGQLFELCRSTKEDLLQKLERMEK